MLEETEHGVICHKCNAHLDDVENPVPGRKRSACGVMRRLVVPTLGSALMLSSCEKDKKIEQKPIPPHHDKKEIVPGMYLPPEGDGVPGGSYPIAQTTDEPGIVISPYTGKKVSVEGMKEGQLVLDPMFKMEDRKFFRVPAQE